MEITIPAIPPSLNKYAGRRNCWEYRTEKQEWLRMVRAYAKKPKKPYEKALVRITYYFPTRIRHDADNYLKFILDGLTFAGVIKDDSLGSIKLEVIGAYDKRNPRTEIEVTELEEKQ